MLWVLSLPTEGFFKTLKEAKRLPASCLKQVHCRAGIALWPVNLRWKSWATGQRVTIFETTGLRSAQSLKSKIPLKTVGRYQPEMEGQFPTEGIPQSVHRRLGRGYCGLRYRAICVWRCSHPSHYPPFAPRCCNLHSRKWQKLQADLAIICFSSLRYIPPSAKLMSLISGPAVSRGTYRGPRL